jgi:hypothetical protein
MSSNDKTNKKTLSGGAKDHIDNKDSIYEVEANEETFDAYNPNKEKQKPWNGTDFLSLTNYIEQNLRRQLAAKNVEEIVIFNTYKGVPYESLRTSAPDLIDTKCTFMNAQLQKDVYGGIRKLELESQFNSYKWLIYMLTSIETALGVFESTPIPTGAVVDGTTLTFPTLTEINECINEIKYLNLPIDDLRFENYWKACNKVLRNGNDASPQLTPYNVLKMI